jgi:hypothetical protein
VHKYLLEGTGKDGVTKIEKKIVNYEDKNLLFERGKYSQ